MSKKKIHRASFVDRPNRFLGHVKLNNEIVEAFIPNPGRMYELMVPGKEVYVRETLKKERRTRYDLIGVKHDGVLVSIDSFLPNRFMKRILSDGTLDEFVGYETVKSEPRIYEGRFDFLLEGSAGKAYIEVKSCTLVEDGRAIFPDAPTKRGARHVRSLAKALREKIVERAAVVFVIQRPDAIIFSPNDYTDPKFGSALRESNDQGVEVYALRTEVIDWDLKLLGKIPIELNHFSADK